MASSSRMTAAMTCSCTSALSNVPVLVRCVKARRSATKSSPIVALANLRPTICAPLDERFFRTPGAPLKIASKQEKGRTVVRPFFACVTEALLLRGVLYDVGQLAELELGG